MVMHLTNKDIQDRIIDHFQKAVTYYLLKMDECFMTEYYKGFTYLDMFHELGYPDDCLEDGIAEIVKTCNNYRLNLKLERTGKCENTPFKGQ